MKKESIAKYYLGYAYHCQSGVSQSAVGKPLPNLTPKISNFVHKLNVQRFIKVFQK